MSHLSWVRVCLSISNRKLPPEKREGPNQRARLMPQRSKPCQLFFMVQNKHLVHRVHARTCTDARVYTHRCTGQRTHTNTHTLQNVNVFLVRSGSRLLASQLSRPPSSIAPTDIMSTPSLHFPRERLEENIAVMLVWPTLQTPDSVFLLMVMTLTAGGDGAYRKYFLRGMVHKTKHKSPLNSE